MGPPRLPVAPAQLALAEITLKEAEFRYLGRVLRLGVGDAVVLFDGAGQEADARVVRAGARELVLAVDARRAVAAAAVRLTLLMALLKHEKMDWIVQKATELGASAIVPLTSERAVVKLSGERAATRVERWRKIALEAARQSGRAVCPDVAEVRPFADVLAEPADLRLLFWEEQRARPLAAALAPPGQVRRIAVLIGPEGGFTAGEAAAAEAAGFVAVGLGPWILRAETAALAALSILQWHHGALGG